MLSHELELDRVDTATPEHIRSALPSDEAMLLIARTFQALSDSTRSKIVLALIRRELCVSELATIVGATQSAVSHHLRGLRDIRLVKFRRDGNNIYYSIDDAHVGNLFREAVAHLEHIYGNLPDHPVPQSAALV